MIAIGVTATVLAQAPSLGFAAFICSGQVTYLGTQNDGGLAFSNGFGIWVLCDIDGSYQGVSEALCRSWYATFLYAQAAEKKIDLYFDYPASYGLNDSRCAALGSWTTPNPFPYHLQVRNP